MSSEAFSDGSAVGLVAGVVAPIVAVMVWAFRHLIGSVVPAMDRVSQSLTKLGRVMRRDRRSIEGKLDTVANTMRENTQALNTLVSRPCGCSPRNESPHA